jgi:hypothetical protein
MTAEKQHPSTHAKGRMDLSPEQWEAGVGRAAHRSARGKSPGIWQCQYFLTEYTDPNFDMSVYVVWHREGEIESSLSASWHIMDQRYWVEWEGLEPNIDALVDTIGVEPLQSSEGDEFWQGNEKFWSE